MIPCSGSTTTLLTQWLLGGVFSASFTEGRRRWQIGEGEEMSTKAILIRQLQSPVPRVAPSGTSLTIPGGGEGGELHAHQIIPTTELHRFLRLRRGQ